MRPGTVQVAATPPQEAPARMLTEPTFYATAVPAVILLGLSKGGFAGLGVLGMPLMALTIPPVQAAAITLPILMIQDVFSIWVYRRSWDRTNLRILLPGAIVGIMLAYLLAARVPDAAVALVLGVISIVFAARRFLAARYAAAPAPAAPPSRRAGWFWGTVAGFTSMIAHAGGPPFQIYVLPQHLPRDVFVGTGVVFFTLVNLIKVPPYLALGQLTIQSLLTSVALFPLAIVSTFGGVWLVRRFSSERFYDVVYVLLFLLGCKLVADGVLWLAG
jgi:uncharacterized membrane protein YfcA